MSKKQKKDQFVGMTREFKPKTINQHHYVRSIAENQITFCTGPAGSGKTHIAVGLACEYFVSGKVDRIILTRPFIESGRGIGFLPGTMNEKVHFYMIPLLHEMYMYIDPFKVEQMIREETIEISPLEFMRGRNFHNSFMILDEAQNATYDQIKMFLTRIGHNTKCVINGDIRQSDLRHHDGINDLEFCMKKLENVDSVGIMNLTVQDIQRNQIIGHVLERLP